MNPIVKALDEIKYRIPIQILQLAFQRDEWNYYNPNLSMDEQIRLKVINPRILFDLDMVGGEQVTIPLDGLQPLSADSGFIVYQIPSERTYNRTIVSVLSIGYLSNNALPGWGCAGGASSFLSGMSANPLINSTQRIADSMSVLPPVSNATAEIIGHNTIIIRDTRITGSYYVRCILSHEENLNTIKLRSFPNLSKLCELAVKSYIYNKLIVRIDQAFLQGGQELGRVKEIIDSYSDSEELYQTYLRETMAKVSVMNDNISYERLIRIQVSPGI